LFLFFACKPPKENQNKIPEIISSAFVVLNEGLFQNNNSSLTWFHWHSRQSSNDMFEQKNGYGLGDTGNDLGIYGEKIYVLMNNSHLLHILNRKNGKLLHQIPLIENGIGASPRTLAFHSGFIYVSAFNGFLYKIDTTNFNISDKIELGTNPDQTLLVYDELWISNSGGLSAQGDSTLSIVDLATFSEVQRVIVGRNPGSLTADGDFVYAVARGNYMNIPSRLVKISIANKTIQRNEVIPCSSVYFSNNKLFKIGYYFESSSSTLHEINPNDFTELTDNLIEQLGIQTLYNFSELDVFGQKIYVFLDARQFMHLGSATVTDANFNKLFDFKTGLNPTKIIFNAP
jgi:hypothetical protein